MHKILSKKALFLALIFTVITNVYVQASYLENEVSPEYEIIHPELEQPEYEVSNDEEEKAEVEVNQHFSNLSIPVDLNSRIVVSNENELRGILNGINSLSMNNTSIIATVYVYDSFTLSNTIDIPSNMNVIFIGAGVGTTPVSITSDVTGRHFNVQGTLTLQNITLTRNNVGSTASSGGVQVNGGTLNLNEGANIVGNLNNNGGGVHVAVNGLLNVYSNAFIVDNTATRAGNAIYSLGITIINGGTITN